MELNDHKLDCDLMRDGARVSLTDDETSGVIVRRIGNAEFRAKIAELLEPHVEAERKGELDRGLQDEITGRAMAGTVLVGWWGWTEDDEPFEFSVENAERVMTDPQLVEVRDIIAAAASSRERFLAKREAESAGN